MDSRTDRPAHAERTVTLEALDFQHQQELLEAVREVLTEPESAKRLWWARPGYTLADARTFITHCVEDRVRGSGEAFVVRCDEGRFIGCVSAKHIDRLHGCFQAGYWLVPSARGKGQGQASLRALWAWAQGAGM